jgi:hypothetical protein
MKNRASLLWNALALLAVTCIGCQGQPASSAQGAEIDPPMRTYRHPPRQVPNHVQTAVYLWTPEQENADPAEFRPFVTWAYPLFRLYARVQRAGIKTVLYANPLMPVPGNSYEFPAFQGSRANLQAKDCNGDTVRSYDGKGYLLDVMQPQAAHFVRESVDYYLNRVREYLPARSRVPVNLMFIDNANSFYGVSPMPCGFDQQRWTEGMASALAGTPYPVVINTLSVGLSQVPAKVQALRGRNVVGEMYEHCFVDRQWSAEETAQIEALALLRALHKKPGPGFWCYVNGGSSTGLTADAATSQRLFNYASFLLSYDPAYSVYQTAYASPPSTFSVMPETQLVPMDPQRRVKDIESLRAPGGAYVQQFQYCYYRRKALGPCEVAVNPGDGAAELPNYHHYHHTVVLSGNGVLDGGHVRFDGRLADDLPPQSAAILVR